MSTNVPPVAQDLDTLCVNTIRTLAADAWEYTADVTEAACLAACEKVHCTCFDTK